MCALFGACTLFNSFDMDPFTAGAILVGASTLIGGAINSFSTASANASNLRINRENIQAQKEENALNRQWNEKMVDQQNEYNSAVNQSARLKAAGINPYVSGLDGSGIQTSSPSYSTGLNTQQPNIQASPFGDAISQAGSQVGNMLFNSQMQRAQADGIILDNNLKASNMAANISAAYSKAGQEAAAKRIAEKNAEISEATFDDVVAKNHAERQQAEQNYLKSIEETHAVELANKAAELNLSWLNKEKSTNILEAYSRMRLNNANAKQALASAFAQNNLGKLYQSQKRQIDKLLPYMEQDYQQKVSLGINQNKLMTWQTQSAKNESLAKPYFDGDFANGWMKFFNTYVNPIGSAVWGASPLLPSRRLRVGKK